MRLFFAVELPAEVRAELGRLKGDNAGREYRWVATELLHVTLVFLGEQPAERLKALREAGEAAGQMSRAGRLRLGAAGSFGARRAPRVLWLGLSGDLDALSELHAHLVSELQRAGVEVAAEERPYSPHITLARRRESARPGSGSGPSWALDASSDLGSEFALDRLTLFESRLSPKGPSYTPLLVVPLRG